MMCHLLETLTEHLDSWNYTLDEMHLSNLTHKNRVSLLISSLFQQSLYVIQQTILVFTKWITLF